MRINWYKVTPIIVCVIVVLVFVGIVINRYEGMCTPRIQGTQGCNCGYTIGQPLYVGSELIAMNGFLPK